jgi:hypothetical protein
MKPRTKIIFCIPFCGLLLSASCKKPKTPPPGDPFANLSNQLVCKINGSEWRSNEKRGGFFYSPTAGREYIRLVFTNSRDELTVYINAPYDKPFYLFNKQTQTYPNLNYPEDYLAFFRGYPDLTPSEEYVTNTTDTGKVDIVLMDSVRNRIRGKFFFTGKDSRTGNKKTITEGYFDYHQ